MKGENLIRVATLNKSNYTNHLPNQENAIVHSQTRNFAHTFQKPTLSFKYVLSGLENYRLDGRTYVLKANEFLLVNDARDYQGESHEKSRLEEGVCIYLSMSLLDEVYQVLQNSEDYLTDNLTAQSSLNLEFLEKVYTAQAGELGAFLQQTAWQISQNPEEKLPNHWEFYFNLAEKLLIQQSKVLQQVDRLKTAKNSTRQELFRRLEVAKEYMDDNYYKKLDIEEISRVAAISEYHFFRSFKQVYNISPYQYLLKKRLQKSIDLLTNHCCSVTETAYLIGFSDIHSFSKSFKKEFRLSPLELLQQNPKRNLRA